MPDNSVPPLKRLPDRSWIRRAYRAEEYSVPPRELEGLRGGRISAIDEMALYDGALQNYDRIGETEREGVRWLHLAERSQGWHLELALTNEVPMAVRPLPPEDAWVHARIQDQRSWSYIPIEGEPPAGVEDPFPRPK